MYLDVGSLTIEVLDHGDYPFLNQVRNEILGDYDFDSIPWEPGDCVIDVGGHVGIVAIYLAKRFGVRVYSYEPMPANFRSLVQNVGANQAEVIPRNLAVTADRRELDIYFGSHSGEGGAFHNIGGGFERVESVTVSDIFEQNNIDRCKLLKLDCEGAEHEILADSGDWLDRVDYLRGEAHLNTLLREAGYSVEETLAVFPPERSKWQVCETTA